MNQEIQKLNSRVRGLYFLCAFLVAVNISKGLRLLELESRVSGRDQEAAIRECLQAVALIGEKLFELEQRTNRTYRVPATFPTASGLNQEGAYCGP